MKLLIQKSYNETSTALNSIYKKRKVALFFQRIMWAITGGFFVLVLLNLASNFFPLLKLDFLNPFQATAANPYAIYYPIIAFVVLLYPATIFFVKAFQKFKSKEMETIAKMVKTLFPSVEFKPYAIAPKKEIVNSKIFPSIDSSSSVISYGQIKSLVDDQQVTINDVGITEATVSSTFLSILLRIPGINIFVVLYHFVLRNIFTKKSADNVQYTFRGMFCWINFKKNLEGHTLVLSNNQNVKLDIFSSFRFTDKEKVQLEDPRFTDQFMVYSTDQTEARYVLSPALMERILTLKEKFNQPIFLSFHDQQIYLAVKNSNGLFAFPSGKLDSIRIIEELANDIDTALHLSNDLK